MLDHQNITTLEIRIHNFFSINEYVLNKDNVGPNFVGVLSFNTKKKIIHLLLSKTLAAIFSKLYFLTYDISPLMSSIVYRYTVYTHLMDSPYNTVYLTQICLPSY